MNWLIGHLVGDYLLQNDWMASNKKKSSLVCLAHVGLYIISIRLLTSWPIWALGIIAVTHFIQDRTNVINWYMKIMKQEKFAKPPLAPWSIIVVDNTFHLLTLFLISLYCEPAQVLWMT